MSLALFEQKVEALTAAIQALTTAMQSGPAALLQTTGGDTEPAKRTRRTKEQIAADNAKSDYPLLEGDPEGTRYWVIEKHNTVFKQTPDLAAPSIEGATIETGAHYLVKKEEFAKKALTSAPGGQTGAGTTSTASSEKPADVPANGATFKQVVDGLMAINAKEGLGTPALKAFLAKHNVEKVPGLEALKKNDELLAEINAILTPAVAEEANLFG